jgi:transcription elongation factor GreA
VENPDEIKSFVSASPGDALVQLLGSLGKPADVAAIKGALNDLVPATGWTSWWNKARSHPRVLTSGSGSRLRYSVSHSAESAIDALFDELRTAQPRDRLAIARRLANRDPDAALEASTVLIESLPDLARLDPGLAWETAGVVADLPGGTDAAADCRDRLIADASHLQLLSGIQDRSERSKALTAIRSAGHEQWVDTWAEWLLHEQHPVVLGSIASDLEAAGQAETLDASLEAVFRNHTDHPTQFVWACELITDDDCPEPIRRRMTPSLLEKIPDTLTRGEFGPVRASAKALLEGGRVAVRLILESASAQQTERFIARLGRISGVEPQRLKVLEQAARQAQGVTREEHAPVFVATRSAVEAKRAELKQLLDVEIPKTLKGIQAAAADGDLRENFEYHMLRDRQELQSAKAAALQRDLGRVQILEPGAADPSQVNVGTVVEFTDHDGQPLEPVTILGSWDADVDRRIFANGSGLAQRLLGRGVGEEVELDGVRATIQVIDPWTTEEQA